MESETGIGKVVTKRTRRKVWSERESHRKVLADSKRGTDRTRVLRKDVQAEPERIAER